MKFSISNGAFKGVRLACCLAAVSLASGFQVARAGILDDIGGAISSLRGQKARKIDAAQSARSKANAQGNQVEFLHQRLLKTSRLLDRANANYANSYRQMQATERQIAAIQARTALVEARFKGHRTQFGLRLASMQRHGQTNFLQVALGSASLSDLSRRTTYFQALTERDALMQEGLKRDKIELLTSQNALMAQWRQRKNLQKQAQRERNRIAEGETEQMQTWKQMSKARYALLSYALQQERALGDIDGKIGNLRERQADIAAENQARQNRIAARQRALEEYQAQMARERAQMRAQTTYRSRVRRRVVRDYSRFQSRSRRVAEAPRQNSRSYRSRYSSSRYRSRSRYRNTRYARNSRSSIRYNGAMPKFPPSQLAPRVGLMPRYAPRIELAPMPIEALQNPAKFTLPMQ